jgi:hypothetical protein
MQFLVRIFIFNDKNKLKYVLSHKGVKDLLTQMKEISKYFRQIFLLTPTILKLRANENIKTFLKSKRI